MSDVAGDRTGTLSTLDNGLRALLVLARAPGGLLVTELATEVGVHRSVAHRILRTLEQHAFVKRDDNKRYTCSGGLIELAEAVDRDLRTVVRPLLEELAEVTEATAYLMRAEDVGQNERARAIFVVEPRNTFMHVAFKPGQAHPIQIGSGGIGILAGRPAGIDDTADVIAARERGYAHSHGAIVPATTGVACPVVLPGLLCEMSVGVSLLREDEPLDRIVGMVQDIARRIATALTDAHLTATSR